MGKRIVNVTKDVDLAKLYGVDEGAALVKKCATAKFDETVELHARLGVDPKQADQQVRGTVGLPHGLGKTKKVAVVTQGEKQKDAADAGADIVGGAELVEQISKGFLDFEILVATPDMMKDLAQIAKLLGERTGYARRGYRLACHCGPEGGQVVYHVHFHFTAGRRG